MDLFVDWKIQPNSHKQKTCESKKESIPMMTNSFFFLKMKRTSPNQARIKDTQSQTCEISVTKTKPIKPTRQNGLLIFLQRSFSKMQKIIFKTETHAQKAKKKIANGVICQSFFASFLASFFVIFLAMQSSYSFLDFAMASRTIVSNSSFLEAKAKTKLECSFFSFK